MKMLRLKSCEASDDPSLAPAGVAEALQQTMEAA